MASILAAHPRQPSPWADRLGIWTSALCVVHCLLSAIALTMLSLAGGIFVSHEVHAAGLLVAMPLAAFALGRGALRHGEWLPMAVGGLALGVMAGALGMPHHDGEVAWTLMGVGLLAFAHDLNRRAS